MTVIYFLTKKKNKFILWFDLYFKTGKSARFIYFLKGIDTKMDNKNGQSSNYKNKTHKKMPN